MSWNDEKIELLKKLWAEGLSASAIELQLGKSRNAVIGKVHRLGLPGRDTTKKFRQVQSGREAAKRHREAKRKAAAAKQPTALQALFKAEPFESKPIFDVPEHERKLLDDLNERDCRFPYGDGPFTFCARPKVSGLPYCRQHAQVCYQPPAPARREPAANRLRLVADNDSEILDTEVGKEKIATSGAVKAKETV